MCKRRVLLAVTITLVCVLGAPIMRGTGLVSPGGLKGEYFNNLWSYWPYGMPEVIRIDRQIDFNWGNSSPAPGVNANTFTVLWTGYLEAPATDTYTFTIQTDDRVSLRIGGASVVSYSPGYVHSSTHQGKIELTGGQVYAFWMTYQVDKDEAGVQLFWESASLARQIVPASALQPPLLAEDPTPADGAVEVVQNITLQWAPGSRATHHDLYLDEDPNAVANATIAGPGVYRGRQPLNATTFNTGPLKWGRTYYWRVDEVNEAEPSSPWKGPVWHFTTAADYIPVDDFESYTDEEGERIYETWIDGWFNGTASTVGFFCSVEFYVPPIHGGQQSMPFDYNNTKLPYYSEAYRTWDVPQDWTVNGVSDLSLWLLGNPIPFLERPDGTVVMSAPGGDDGRSDLYMFASKRLSGDGEIVARIDSFTSAKDWARAGVMMREGLSYGSRYAAVTVTVDHGVSFARAADNPFGPGVQTNDPGPQVPHWVRLTRRGDIFTAQHSQDGVTWQDVKDTNGKAVAATIAMSKDLYVGLCAVGYAWRAAAKAEFSQIVTSGAVTGPWQPPQDDDCIRRVNNPDRLYVAVEDKAGRVGVVVHPDPAVANVTEWTQWKIPLSRFDPVNLQAVKRMYIGLGDRGNPKPNGTGLIHIDDIRVVRSTSHP